MLHWLHFTLLGQEKSPLCAYSQAKSCLGGPYLIKMSDCSVFCAAVHCEGLSGGKDGGDPEEEAGPGGEGFRLHQQ